MSCQWKSPKTTGVRDPLVHREEENSCKYEERFPFLEEFPMILKNCYHSVEISPEPPKSLDSTAGQSKNRWIDGSKGEDFVSIFGAHFDVACARRGGGEKRLGELLLEARRKHFYSQVGKTERSKHTQTHEANTPVGMVECATGNNAPPLRQPPRFRDESNPRKRRLDSTVGK
ncbi:hypothetical protein TSMEX_005218 [Taenia solium]|eukprot:TsM_000273000 transcript=TsM_000273000 gene=TsM_000273000